MSDKKEKIQIKISLTPEEFKILKEFSELQGKPMASSLMNFVREANVFTVLAGTNKTIKKIIKLKQSLGNKAGSSSDDLQIAN